MTDPKFSKGDIVRRKSQPNLVGVVKEPSWNDALEEWSYTVQFGVAKKAVLETDLELLPDTLDPWDDLTRGSFATADALRTLLTFERLRRPPTRLAGSFGSAKATFLPYQFKPLLKFLENSSQRILIADDVGLGKTIEAGYILRELRARTPLETVLIVVPARLRSKWKQELERRFDERFELVGRSEVTRALLAKLKKGRVPDPFNWIASYESLRSQTVIDGFKEHQPAIDLVILDEAHRVRNRETLQNQLARELAQYAVGMLFLTATPVQTGIDNLFQLLHLLEPEAFPDAVSFEAQLRANRPVLEALGALRSSPPDLRGARKHLERLAAEPLTAPLAAGPFFQGIRDRLEADTIARRDDLVELQRDVSELSLTAHVISRTRKAEVLPDRPTREAISQRVPLSVAERAFYDSVAELCRVVAPASNAWGQEMGALMAFRYTASCIPAALRYFRDRLGAAGADFRKEARRETEDERAWMKSSGAGDPGGGDATNADLLRRLERIVREVAPPEGVDSKFARFRDVLDRVWRDDDSAHRPRRKVVVFSFFKRTLAYLDERFLGLGINHRCISGDLSIPEREEHIETFATDPDVLVLLSSEVGSEGLDLQIASVVVNYDLPWNPMVVEQRIGRLDRIGQQSPIVHIVNLIAQGTVEERILLRLYNRIGIFKETIGEIDPILGDTVEQLAIDALRGTLTIAEESNRLETAAHAFVTQTTQAQNLMQQSDSLIAADQAFLDEIEALLGRRRVPVPEELHRFVHDFIRERYPGSKIPEECIHSEAMISLDPRVGMDLQNALHPDVEARRVGDRISQGPLPATFDPAVILTRPRADLVFLRHPLVRFAVSRMEEERDTLHRAFRVRIKEPAAVNAGTYAFSVWQFEIQGLRPRTELVSVFVPVDGGTTLTEEQSEGLFLALLDTAETFETPESPAPEALERARSAMMNHMHRLTAELMTREKTLGEARVARRRATQEGSLRARVEAASQRRDSLRKSGAAAFPVRMAEARLKKETQRLEAFRAQAEESLRPEIDRTEIAVGLLHVEA